VIILKLSLAPKFSHYRTPVVEFALVEECLLITTLTEEYKSVINVQDMIETEIPIFKESVYVYKI
jgi:hypothetical protein